MISPSKKNIHDFLRKTGLFILIVMGLLSIVGTGDEEDNGSNSAPSVRILAPSDSAVFMLDNEVTFTGTATDAEENSLKGSALAWTSSLDGHIGSGASFTTDNLSKGTHVITLTATDSQGLADSATLSITINPENNTLPTATITNPATGKTFNEGDLILFTGTGFDTEDQWLDGPYLLWYSNKDGQIGIGSSVDTRSLSRGTHTISLKATDSENTSDIDSITVIIGNTAPVAAITYPADGATFQAGEAIPFVGSGYDSNDGDLSGNSLTWTAGNNTLGHGETITVSSLGSGDHVINLRVEDKEGLVDSDSITITIE